MSRPLTQKRKLMHNARHNAELISDVRIRAAKIIESFLFEANDRLTRDAITGQLNMLLSSMDELEDFTVLVDESNNTIERINKNELWVDLAIQPKGNTQFIFIPFRVKPEEKADMT
jgi:hypothetical protein